MEDVILFKISRGLCLLSIMLILLIVIPSSFAHENVTEVIADDESSNPLERINDDVEIIKDASNDYYFNASAVDDSGDG